MKGAITWMLITVAVIVFFVLAYLTSPIEPLTEEEQIKTEER